MRLVAPWRWFAMPALLLAGLLPPAAAMAGETAAVLQRPSAPAPGAVAPIPVQDILARAQEEQRRIDEVRRLLARPAPLAELQHTLDDVARPVDAKLLLAAGVKLRSLSVMRLESLARHWDFDARRLERWHKQADEVMAPYSRAALQLAQHRAAWSLTRAEGMLDGLPRVFAERIDALIAQIDEAEAGLELALSQQLALSQRAADVKSRIEAGRSETSAAIDDIDRRLLARDVTPLWQGLGTMAGGLETMAVLERGLEIEEQFALDYQAAGTGNQQALRLLQLLLLPLIVWLVYRSRLARTPGAPADHVALALRRPVSTWLLLSMLSLLAFEPDAPVLVQEAALLLALVPLWRLLPRATVRALGAWPYLAIGLYGLNSLSLAVAADGGWYRILLLVLDAAAIGLTAWMLRVRNAPAQSAAEQRLQNMVRKFAWVVMAILAVAAASNVAGNVSLSEMLTGAVIDSGYMALLLYAGVGAGLGLLRTLLGQPELAGRRLVQRDGPALERGARRLLTLGAVAGWLVYSADLFRVWRSFRAAAAWLMQLGVEIGEVSVRLGDVTVFVVAIWGALWVARGMRQLLRDELAGHVGLPRGVGSSIASLSYYGMLAVGFLVALSAAGFKVSQLALVFGALGVGIGFGLQNVVNNFVSGLVLMFERPIQPGDVVDAAGCSGSVREIGLRATIIRTFDGAEVIVPNGLLLGGNLTNWTMFDRSRRIEVTVRLDYGTDPATVLSVLDAAARGTPGIAQAPAPEALLTGYDDNALSFVVRAWVDDLNGLLAVRSNLLARIAAALGAAGLALAPDKLDLYLRRAPAA